MSDAVEVIIAETLIAEAIERGPQGPSPSRSLYDARVISPLSGVLTIDCNLGTSFLANLSENVSSVVFLNVPDTTHSQGIELYLRQPSGGGRTVAGWPPAYWPNQALPALSSAPNAIDVVVVKSAFGILFATLVGSAYGLVT